MSKRGHEAPLLDNSSKGDLFSSLPVPEQIQTDPVMPAEASPAPIKSREEIMEEFHKRSVERDARRDQLTRSNWPPGRIKEQLDKEFPDLLTSEDLEEREKARGRQARKRIAAEGGTHPTGPRGKKYFFDNDNARVDSDRNYD
jgi:hypothetical protein